MNLLLISDARSLQYFFNAIIAVALVTITKSTKITGPGIIRLIIVPILAPKIAAGSVNVIIL